MAPAAAPRDGRTGYALAAAVSGFAFLLALFPLQCHDVWWHLANGREVALGRGIPRTNLYSFTHPDYPVTPTHWLFGLGAYLVHRLAGPSGLVAAKSLVIAAAFLLAYILARRRGASDASAGVVVAVAVLAARTRFLERPHLFTMLGLVIFALVIDRFRNGSRRIIWALPVLAALWANLHAGCLFGVGLLGLEAAGEGASWLLARRREGSDSEAAGTSGGRAAYLGAAALACALAVTISPAGWSVYPYNLWHVGLGEVVELVEFGTPTPWGAPWFFLLLTGGAAALALDRERVSAREILVFVVFGMLALYAVRGVPNFVLLAAPIVAPRLSRAWSSLREREGWAKIARSTERVPQCVLGVLLILVPFSGHLLGGPLRDFRVGLGVRRGFFPETSAEFVLRELPDARVFNDLATGGYLAWRWYPDRRIFLDGRTNAYPPELFKTLYGYRSRAESAMKRDLAEFGDVDDRSELERSHLREELERTVESVGGRYGLDAMLLYFYKGGNRFWPGARLDGWAVVHSERAGLVLVRRGRGHGELIRRCERRLGAEGEAFLSGRLARRGSEFALPAASAADRALKAEAASGRRVFEPRRRAALHMRRGNGRRLAGRPKDAVGDYRKVLEIEPGRVEARLNLGFALLGSGRPREAAPEFERVLHEGDDQGLTMHYALYGLAETLRALGETEAALARYEEFLKAGEGRTADREKARKMIDALRRER